MHKYLDFTAYFHGILIYILCKDDIHAEIKSKECVKDKMQTIQLFSFGQMEDFNKTCPSGTENETENAHCEAKC